jgi:phosphohistidine phosphatase
MVKTLVLVRHAKSNWDNPGLSDFDRPLNQRGVADAPVMASAVSKLIATPDLIISSPARRAIDTAEYFAEAMAYPEDKIVKNMDIYEHGFDILLDIIKELPPSKDLVVLFGHNPVLTHLATFLCGEVIGNMPTCSAVGIRFDSSWSEAGTSRGKLIFFEYPKKYRAK